jgi:hypothetical protein
MRRFAVLLALLLVLPLALVQAILLVLPLSLLLILLIRPDDVDAIGGG